MDEAQEVDAYVSIGNPAEKRRGRGMRILQKLDSLLELVGQGAGGYYRIRNY